jgi:hypothetical protein
MSDQVKRLNIFQRAERKFAMARGKRRQEESYSHPNRSAGVPFLSYRFGLSTLNLHQPETSHLILLAYDAEGVFTPAR